MPSYALASTTMYPGLFTDNVDRMQDFYTGEGLRFMEKLQQSDTYAELFFELPGCKLKIQSDSSGGMEPSASGYRGLRIARDDLESTRVVTDPDGLTVTFVPYGQDGVTSVGFEVTVPDVAKYEQFLRDAMGGRPNEFGYRVGDTQLFLTEDPNLPPNTPICRRGFCYITLIVHDTLSAHASVVAAGGEDSLGLSRLHDRCLFSFVKDPFGNWIEIVQYANLSGPLPEHVRFLEDHLDRIVEWREQGGGVLMALPFTVLPKTLDIGLFSDRADTRAFYEDTLGLPFREGLQHSPTYEERFYELGDSALKINYSTEPMLPGRSGYRGLVIARPGVVKPTRYTDPEGVVVDIVPPGYERVTSVGVRVVVDDLAGQRKFLEDGFGATVDDQSVLLGTTRLLLEPGTGVIHRDPTWRRGFNYIVVFVDDTVAAHQHLLEVGAEHGMRPIRLPDRCIFSWVRDPNGNWIELVQYKDPDGPPLPDDIAPIQDYWPQVIAWREGAVPF